MEPADLFAKLFEAVRFDQNVIMVRQDTPGVNDARVIPTSFQRVVLAFGHPLVAGADNVRMLEAGSGGQLLHLSARTRCRWSLRFQVSCLTLLLRRTNRSGPVDFLPRIFAEVAAHRHKVMPTGIYTCLTVRNNLGQ